jgi:hypothetical protein
MKVFYLMKHRLILPGVLAVVLLFAACAPPPLLRDEKLLQDTSLMTNEPCAAPCWHGITPGETLWRNALTALEDDTNYENVEVQEDDQSDAKVVQWQQKGGTGCCQMFTQDGETVSLIFLRTAPNVSLGELIEAQGEPTYIVGTPFSDDQAIVNLIYPEKSLVVYAFVPGTEGSLSESSELVGVLYMTPADMDLLIKTSNLHDWDGYQSYQAYEQSEFEVTPSVTLTPTATGG